MNILSVITIHPNVAAAWEAVARAAIATLLAEGHCIIDAVGEKAEARPDGCLEISSALRTDRGDFPVVLVVPADGWRYATVGEA